MFRNSYQSGFLSILYSVGSQPLALWERRVENGHIKRISDEDVKSQVVEIAGTNVATTYIFCPQNPKVSLGVKLKFLVMLIKNLNKYFSFEITVLDNTNVRRRLRASNYQSTTRVRPFSCSMPMTLNPGWNQVQFNLADFTRRAYGTEYIETSRIQIHANCRIRRVYFTDKLYTEDEVPPEYRLYVNDDPRTRRFSEPATAMTSAALTAAAMAGGPPRPIDCSGAAAAPPTPCGGDILRDPLPLPEEKMKSFIGAQAPVSTERLLSLTGQASYFREKMTSISKTGYQASIPVSGFKPASFPSPGMKANTVSGGESQPPISASKQSSTFTPAGYPIGSAATSLIGSQLPFAGSLAASPTVASSLIPMTGSKLPSDVAAGSIGPLLSPEQTSYTAAASPQGPTFANEAIQ